MATQLSMQELVNKASDFGLAPLLRPNMNRDSWIKKMTPMIKRCTSCLRLIRRGWCVPHAQSEMTTTAIPNRMAGTVKTPRPDRLIFIATVLPPNRIQTQCRFPDPPPGLDRLW